MLPVFQNALVLTGPTASGKTDLALTLAERWGAEIISMDSMALYRGMDLGTAKPTAEQSRRVPHHLIDVVDPWESATVAWWLAQATRQCLELEGRGRRALFVGGTPLYLKALLFGLFEGPPVDATLRRRLEELGRTLGPGLLHERLAKVDPASAARLHPRDLRRLVRALEVFEQTGQRLSDLQTQWRQTGAESEATPQVGKANIWWLDPPRPLLHERINQRVEAMFAAGLVDEVRGLINLEKPLSREAAQALGYKEVIAHLAGKTTLAETMALVQTRSRQFAKRQITWFRHLPGHRVQRLGGTPREALAVLENYLPDKTGGA